MRDCETNHPNCPKEKELVMPTRVLDLQIDQNTEDVRLLSASGCTGRYACLSYCWGAPQPISLKAGVLSENMKRIMLLDLPQSIQDAIRVARTLGFRYLWIDSLCIIQDSPEDNACEIEQMWRVYNNANLTISAGNADQYFSGFLKGREQTWSE
jgi:Heterokaryon incompatibility protein (HET)